MSRPYYSVKHVESMALLPAKLTRGRAYFVDDEQVIVIDHGQGAVIYGGRPGPQGVAGEPLPQLQSQIDDLATASLTMQKTLWDEVKKHRSDVVRITDTLTAEKEHLQEQTDLNANAILTLTALLNRKFEDYEASLAILSKTVANLYPDHFNPEDKTKYEDPLDNETITTPAGTWTIQQTTLGDGTIILQLEAQELFVETLTVGDSVDFDGSTWTVQAYEKADDGTITLTIKP